MPIIGHGDIAGAIPADLHPDWTWFASGVSNSREVRIEAYDRERALLKAQPRATHLVYFSSLCVFHGRSLYSTHKDVMEFTVKRLFERYTIIRLGNILWGANPHTLINHLRARQAAGLPLDVQPVQRVVHTLADFRYCLALIPDWPCELSAPGRLLSVEQIVREFVTWDYQAVPA
jgi:hypothetical protein